MTSPRLQRMKDAVGSLYERNRQRGTAAWCGHEYDFVCPSTGTYPFQWFWDSCFHTIALAHIDPRRARSEVRSLLRNAQPDGFVAHVTFWQREAYEEMLKTYSIAYRTPYLSDCIQPPVLAEAVAAAAGGDGGDAFLAEVLPRVRGYFDWLHQVRDPDRDGLIATLQPDESGLDHTPKYDAYLGITGTALEDFTAAWDRVAGPYAEVGRDPQRMFALDRFVVEDVLVNTIYGENQRVLGDLLERAGDTQGASELRRRSAATTASLVAKCFDRRRGPFLRPRGKGGEAPGREHGFVPDAAGAPRPARVCRRGAGRSSRPIRASTRPLFPVPSVAMDEPSFVPGVVGTKLVWRGPVWMNTNWYISRGLRRHGTTDLARHIEDRSAALVEKSGFREYYDPLTGEGNGAFDFSWTAVALDMLARLEAE